MSTANLDSADLKAVDFGGLINEDVMQRIWDISNIPLPFSDRVGSDGVDNSYTEWTQDRLQAQNLSNAKVDGADTIGDQDTNTGARVGNHCQISTKTVKVSTRARESNTIGFADTLAYQVMMRQRELRRDVEGIAINVQGSQADDGNTTPGLAGSFPSWCTSTVLFGTGGAAGGFSNGVVSAQTPGEARALSETAVRDICQGVYDLGGNPTVFMSTTSVIRKFSEYMFTSSARVATLTGNTSADSGEAALTAKGTVNVFVTDFGVTLDLVANRLQPTYESADVGPIDVANCFVMDPSMVMLGYLHGYRVEELSKTGLADNRQMAVDWTVKVLNQEAQGLIGDIDGSVAAVA